MKTLRGITWQNPRGYNPLVKATADFHQNHPDIEVIWEQQPWYRFEETILASLSAGDGRYDLIMYDHPWTGELANNKWLLAWDELADDAYIAELKQRVVYPSAESYILQDKLWALPLDAACHSALYRADLVNGNELPVVWEQIADWAKAQHDPPRRYGLALCVEGVLGNCLFLSMMAGLGSPAFHLESDPACDPSATEYVLTTIKELLQYTPPGSTHWGPWDMYDHLCASDDVAYSPSIFAYVNYFAGVSWRGEQLRLGTVPRFAQHDIGKPILGGVGLGIAHTCQYIEEATAFGQYLMSDEVQYHIFPQNDGQPATRRVWEDEQINQVFHNFYGDQAHNMQSAYIRPRHAGFHAIELQGGQILQQFWDDNATLSDTVDQLVKLGMQNQPD